MEKTSINLITMSYNKKYPTEKSVINHQIRERLGITCDQYVLVDICAKLFTKNNKYTKLDVCQKIGYNEEIIKIKIKELVSKGLLIISNGNSPNSTDLWKNNFIVSEDEFTVFMAPISFSTRDVRWTGSLAESKTKYETIRKLFSAEYLLDRKIEYFKFLSRKVDRDIMSAPVFLNIKTERFSEKWENYFPCKETVKENAKIVSQHDLLNS